MSAFGSAFKSIPSSNKLGHLSTVCPWEMDLLQEEQSGGARLPLTRTLLFSSSKHVQHRPWQYAGTEGVHLLEEARPEWELTAAGFFQRKSKQGLGCESFRNSIILLLSGEWSYSLPQWKLLCALAVIVLISLCPGEDKIDFFFLPKFDLMQDKIFYKGNTHTVCIKIQAEKEATSSITGQQKYRRTGKIKRNK